MSQLTKHTIYVYPDSHRKGAVEFLQYFLQAKPLVQKMGVKLHVVKVKSLAQFKKKHPQIKKLPALVTEAGSRGGEESILDYYDSNMERFMDQQGDNGATTTTPTDTMIGATVNGLTQLPGMGLGFDNTFIDHARIMREDMAAEQAEEEGLNVNDMNAKMREMARLKQEDRDQLGS